MSSAPYPSLTCCEGCVVRVNTETLALFGANQAKDLEGRPLLDLFALSSRASVADWSRRALDSDPAVPFLEERVVRLDGRVLDVEAVVTRCLQEDKPALRIFLRDITANKRTEQELQFTRCGLDHASIPTFWVNASSQFIYVNEAACRSVGYSREELLSMHVPDINPDYPPEQLDAIWRDLRKRRFVTFEGRHRTKDGRIFPTDSSLTLVEFEGQEYVCGFAVDITARKQAEKALQESETRFRLMAEAMPQFVWVSGPDGVIEYMNQQLVEYMGQTLEEARSGAWTKAFHPDDLPGIQQLWARALTQGTSFDAEVRLKQAATGAYRWFLSRARPAKDPQGRVTKWLGTITDITKQKQAEEALRESEERHRLMVDAIPQLAWRTDAAGRTTECNRRWLDYTGQTLEEARGNGWMKALHPDDVGRVLQRVNDDVAGGEIYQTEYRLRRVLDGVHRWHLARALPIRDRDGTVRCWFGTATDIEDQKRAEEVLLRSQEELEQLAEERTAALRESEQRFRNLVEMSPDGVGIAVDGKIAFLNRAALRLFGATHPSEMVGQPNLNFVHPDDRAVVTQRTQALFDTGQTALPIELRFLRLDGSTIHLEVSSTPVVYQNQPAIQAVFRDLSQRKEAERALRDSEERFRQLATSIREVFYLENADLTQLLYVSPAYEEVWGRTRESLYASPTSWMDAIHPEDRGRTLQAIAVARLRQPYDVEYRVVRPDGSTRWVRDRGFPIRDTAGRVYRVAGICEDITEKKQLERRILEISDREQRRIGHDLHDGLGQLLTGAGFATSSLAESLAGKSLPEAREARDILNFLSQAISQTRDLARALAPVRLEADGLRLALQQLAHTVRDVYRTRCSFAGQSSVLIDDPSAAMHLYRIAQEAVNNAVKHGRPHGIKIGLARRRGVILLTVEDDGIGLPGNASSSAGMGLRIMAYRASMIGGSFTIEQRARGGTVVRCSYPDKIGRPSSGKRRTPRRRLH